MTTDDEGRRARDRLQEALEEKGRRAREIQPGRRCARRRKKDERGLQKKCLGAKKSLDAQREESTVRAWQSCHLGEELMTPYDSLIARLETTLKRQELAVETTRAQLAEARRLKEASAKK